jgi:competence protein ComEA
MARFKITKQDAATVALTALLVAGATYILVHATRQPAPITFTAIPNHEPQKSTPSVLVVDTAGAVNKPGVLHLPGDSRVQDAIRAAGGAASDADLEQLDLAAKLEDGIQVFVPHRGNFGDIGLVAEPYKGGLIAKTLSSIPKPSSRSPGTRTSHKKERPSQPVSLNTASLEQLESIPGIGPSTGQKILDYRTEHGGFSSVDELLAVKGIGPKKLEAMRQFLKL